MFTMELTVKKQRSPNYSHQDCLLLADLMGRDSGHIGMSKARYMRHKFTSAITSASKKMMWSQIADEFNSKSLHRRTQHDLTKKWDNLVQTHKNLYQDYLKAVRQTGGGPCPASLGPVTEAVMAVVGKNAGTLGIPGTEALDSLFVDNNYSSTDAATGSEINFGLEQTTPHAHEDLLSSSAVWSAVIDIPSESAIASNIGISRKRPCCTCSCHDMDLLKSEKLRLEIKKLKRDLGEE